MNSTCYHCGLPINTGDQFCGNILNQKVLFCCAGCLAIAETLTANGLTDFYRFRDKNSTKPVPLIPQEILDLEALDSEEVLQEISSKNEYSRSIELGLEGITCAACGWLIEKHLQLIPQVENISVNVSTQRAHLEWSEEFPLSDILKSLRQLGYHAYPFSEDAREKSFESTNQLYIKRLLVAALGMMQVMTYALAIYIGEFQDLAHEHQSFLYWISGVIATPVVFYSAKPFFISAYRNLKAKQLGMNLPVSIAIASAYSASVYSLLFGGNVYYFDSVVMFTFFLLIGRFLEHRARYRSLLKQQNFQQLLPLSVNKRNTDSSISLLTLSKVVVGDILVINAGSIIPVDGILLEQSAEINEAILTGESVPVNKQPGERLVSGSTNNSSSLVMQVTKDVANSHLKQLISLQQNAEQMKPDSVSLADSIAHWYVLILLILVVISGLYWWYVQPDQVFSIVLSVLVVSCPCALSLATPAAIAAATSQLSDLGFMIRSKQALSSLAKINQIFFDKTGTLTSGTMAITKTHLFAEYNEKQCFEIATILERISAHPIAHAFANDLQSTLKVTNLKEHIGGGVSGCIDNITYHLGNHQFVSGTGVTINESSRHGYEMILYLISQDTHLCSFIIQDKIKPSAIKAVKSLLQSGHKITLISGDDVLAVTQMAKQLNIENSIAGATPEEKLAVINSAQQSNKKVLMVGDGFNDVGALAAASVSITMGSGTSVSKSASDAVLVSSDLTVIPQAIVIAKKVHTIIKQNLSWAIFYNLTAIPFAMMGLVPAWLAALGMSFSSLIVVLNALRLRS